jgi:hypothetical protein
MIATVHTHREDRENELVIRTDSRKLTLPLPPQGGQFLPQSLRLGLRLMANRFGLLQGGLFL